MYGGAEVTNLERLAEWILSGQSLHLEKLSEAASKHYDDSFSY
jgi:hypothetical protein